MSGRGDHISQSDEHNARGIELADRGWLDEAVSEFRKAIQLDPQSAHAHDNLATVLTEKGDLFEALVEYVEALKVDADNPAAHHYLASFLAGQAQPLAIASYKRALDLEYDFPDAHLNLALALANQGRLDEAVVELETAHRQAPTDEMIQHELACCFIDLERYPEAIGHLKEIVLSHPEHVEGFVDLGIAYTAQGFFAEAEAALSRGQQIDPHDFACHYHMAGLYAAWGKPESAFEHLNIATTRDPEKLRLWLEDDRFFDSLREDERFLALFN